MVRGYRIWANISSLNASNLVLVSNTSSTRPTRYWRENAAPSHPLPLPLLPAHSYSLAIQALNAVGGGPLSPALSLTTPVGPEAAFELPLYCWRHGRVGRGGLARHRVFLPVGTSYARVVVQLSASTACCATLLERQLALSTRSLRLYVRAGEHAPDVPLSPPPEKTPEIVPTDENGRPVIDLHNASSSAGEMLFLSSTPHPALLATSCSPRLSSPHATPSPRPSPPHQAS